MATRPTAIESASPSQVDDNSVKDLGIPVHEIREHLIDRDGVATEQSAFDDPVLAPHYWPKDYENIHRFDPPARWT
ncbi:hypothetical protein EDD16DRAFT_1708342 [Pisolithus croceorrhizus]|nr:hypothetical protein EDD16DRAFT_1708342 [Pisolithus croceorrhizus]KAI6166394.1 hypothetical protein EDD17DRAFT_1753242 [Pisolithus thermaeus]